MSNSPYLCSMYRSLTGVKKSIFIFLFSLLFTYSYAINEDCGSAVPLAFNPDGSCAISSPISNQRVSPSPEIPNCFGDPFLPDLWYTATVPADGKFTVVLEAIPGGAGAVQVFRGSCDNLIPINSPFGFNCDFLGWPFTGLTPGETVYIQVLMAPEEDVQVSGFICARSLVKQSVTCGDIATDLGGALENYPNLTFQNVTICPDDPTKVAWIKFTDFATEEEWDGLYVYDGPDTNSPLISSGNPSTLAGFPEGSYYGTEIPGPFFSSHPSGCLTLEFFSDWFTNDRGWVAEVYCYSAIPTLGEWGIIILSLILIVFGVTAVRQRDISII